MTLSLTMLHAIAAEAMDTNHPSAVELHRKAGRVHDRFAADPSRIAQDLALTREAEHLLNAVYCVTEGRAGAPLTAAERLMVAAIIAARANGEDLPFPDNDRAPLIPGDVLDTLRAGLSARDEAFHETQEDHDDYTPDDVAKFERTLAAAHAWLDGAQVPAINADGPYRPALAEAFREGARGLLHCDLGDKIEVRPGAPVEEYPQGDGGALVQCWLLVGDEDRPTMPGEGLYDVRLTAEGIQVTARSSDEAHRFAQEDAREFSGEWNAAAEVSEAEGGRDDAATDSWGADIEVELTEAATGDGDRLWTFRATFDLSVWAESAEDAEQQARAILKGER